METWSSRAEERLGQNNVCLSEVKHVRLYFFVTYLFQVKSPFRFFSPGILATESVSLVRQEFLEAGVTRVAATEEINSR